MEILNTEAKSDLVDLPKVPVRNTKQGILKRIKIGVISFILLFLSCAIFIKVDTGAAANFADNILRPLIGSEKTVALEGVFFNFSDGVNQIFYKFAPPSAPQINNFTPTITKTNNSKNSVVSSNKTLTNPLVTYNNIQNSIQKIDLTPIKVDNNFPPLPKEGQWQQIYFNQFLTGNIMATTFIRPDKERSYAITNLVQIDMSKVGIQAVAGTSQPGGPVGNPGPGKIPNSIQMQNILLGAFNGGFQEKDGGYGMVVDNKTYLPLKNNAASLVIYKSGLIELVNYKGQNLGNDVVAVRQNGPLLIQDGQITPSASSEGMSTWGLTVTNSMYTWRSGIGVTANGNLIYAVGPSLIPSTLAKALQAAGAVSAMQLDINPYWVRFVIFDSQGNGKYKYDSLVKSMQNGGNSYLHGYNKDFFYLYKI